MIRKSLILLFIAISCISCTSETLPNPSKNSVYFNVKDFFKKEADRLNKRHPSVSKTVTVNESSESKVISPIDWKKELEIFSNADIGKKAWIGLFSVKENSDSIIYLSNNPKVPVKRLEIIKNGNNIHRLTAIITRSNAIYHALDTLIYVPDSLYEVRRFQKIKLLNGKTYQIKGLINK